MAEDKIVTLNLRKSLIKTPNSERSKSSLAILKRIIKKKTRADEIKIGKDLNEKIWKGGIKSPPTKLRIRLVKSDGKVTANVMI